MKKLSKENFIKAFIKPQYEFQSSDKLLGTTNRVDFLKNLYDEAARIYKSIFDDAVVDYLRIRPEQLGVAHEGVCIRIPSIDAKLFLICDHNYSFSINDETTLNASKYYFN